LGRIFELLKNAKRPKTLRAEGYAQKAAALETKGLLAGFKDTELLKTGIPEARLPLVRA
jgi:hypothetical protein